MRLVSLPSASSTLGCAVAWFILGGTVVSRTGESDQQLAAEVAQLWGGAAHPDRAHGLGRACRGSSSRSVQATDAKGRLGDAWSHQTVIDRVPVPLVQSRVDVALDLDQRRKGLLWYDTYGVAFAGEYRFHNPDDVPRRMLVLVRLPLRRGPLRRLHVRGGRRCDAAGGRPGSGLAAARELAPGARGGR